MKNFVYFLIGGIIATAIGVYAAKITDYDALGEAPAVGDLFVIVDVSDTTMAATGTTKKLQYSNIGLQPLEATLTDIADGTINENLVNTANPWAVNEGGTGSGTASGALVNLGLNATASEINTPLDGASVTLTEFRELEAIGDTTISAAQWAGLGSATTAGIALWDDANAAAQLVTLGLNATASEINTPLDGASVTLTEFQELETIGATTISANQWAVLGGIAETLAAAELDILDGVSGVTAAELSYIGDVTSLIQAQLDLKAPLANPTFTGTITIGSAGITEPELEILDGATLSTTQINYLASATGTTGTTSTNLVFSTSPQLTTPDLGAATADSLTLDASATPGWVFRDSDNAGTDKEIGKIYSNATTTTDGAEDGEIHIQVMDSGSEKSVYHADGDTGAEHVDVSPVDCTYDTRTYLKVNATDGTYSGIITTRTVDSGQTSVFGQALHIDTDGEAIVADADVAAAGAAPCFGLAIDAGTGAGKKILLHGIITETDWNWTIGGLIYLGDDPTTTEGLTQTAPSTEGDQVQVLGIALSADTILFNPSLVLVEVPAA